MSKLTVSGGCYFTLCSSAVMLGGSLEASFKHGKISASFFSSVDVLVVFDPFYYKFSSEISVSVRWRFIKGRFGVKLVVEGPKMRGKATVDVGVLGSFTIKFGPDSSRQFQAISFGKFVNKHVLQLPEGEITSALSSKFAINALRIKFQKALSRMMTAKNVQEARATHGWLKQSSNLFIAIFSQRVIMYSPLLQSIQIAADGVATQ